MLCGSTPLLLVSAVGATELLPVPGMLLKVLAGRVSRMKLRAEPKIQTLSFLIGPPMDPSVFHSLPMPSAVRTPRAISLSVTLSP